MKKSLKWLAISLLILIIFLSVGWLVWRFAFSGKQLFDAVTEHEYDKARLLLSLGADVNASDKYGFTTLDNDMPSKGIAEIILAKNRNGPVDDILLRFREERAQFIDVEDLDFEAIMQQSAADSFTVGSKMNNDIPSDGNGLSKENGSDDELN